MNALDLSERSLRDLTASQKPLCLSIYVPVPRKPTERDQARIRAKNHLNPAEQGLCDWGAEAEEIDTLWAPVRAALENEAPLGSGSVGLALFRSARTCESLELPEPPRDMTVISDVFYVKPLLSLVNVSRRRAEHYHRI